MPKFELEDIEDYYTYYVMILEISEDMFWNQEHSFLKSIVENIAAFKDWKGYIEEKEAGRK